MNLSQSTLILSLKSGMASDITPHPPESHLLFHLSRLRSQTIWTYFSHVLTANGELFQGSGRRQVTGSATTLTIWWPRGGKIERYRKIGMKGMKGMGEPGTVHVKFHPFICPQICPNTSIIHHNSMSQISLTRPWGLTFQSHFPVCYGLMAISSHYPPPSKQSHSIPSSSRNTKLSEFPSKWKKTAGTSTWGKKMARQDISENLTVLE
jgi:hypothetical protein